MRGFSECSLSPWISCSALVVGLGAHWGAAGSGQSLTCPAASCGIPETSCVVVGTDETKV